MSHAADELFYGGAAGGGKSDLLLGLGCMAHRKSLILRREAEQLSELVDRLKEISGSSGAWRGSGKGGTMYDLPGNRMIQLVGCQHEDDKNNFKGRAHDLKAFDEVSDFSETQYRFISAWNRTTTIGQRCRIVACGNPPTTAEGEWVLRHWGPWLDKNHPYPAKPTELRWYAVVDRQEVERENGDIFEFKREKIKPRSRSFIPAMLSDNAYLMATGYGTTLQGLPEPLRSQLLYGDFTVGREDDAWQCIPSAWVIAAQKRWVPEPPAGQKMSCLGLDVAYGGADSTCPAPRYGNWFGEVKKYQGKDVDTGPKSAYWALLQHKDDCPINVDAIGYGSPCHEALREKIGKLAIAINVQSKPEIDQFDKTGKYKLGSIRAAMYWKLREALDPEKGDNLMLPPDPELLADLCAPRFEVTASGIVLEKKEHIKERIGRSPDKGDAVCLAHYQVRKWKFNVGFV